MDRSYSDILHHPFDDFVLLISRILLLHAMRAIPFHEPLGDDDIDCRGKDVRRDSDIDQPLESLGRGLRMQGGKDEMSGERCLCGNRGGFKVADLSDHDDIRILPDQGSQSCLEGVSVLFIHLTLYDSRHLIFDRVLKGDDLLVRSIEGAEHAVERGRLS